MFIVNINYLLTIDEQNARAHGLSKDILQSFINE
jgi:hypothetical protein